VLPPSFAKYSNPQGNAIHHASSPASYAAIRGGDFRNRDGSGTRSGTMTPDTLNLKSDPTKRVRAKRSKTNVSNDQTPLLSQSHRSIDFHSYNEESSMPLPLMYVTPVLDG
jgi:putative membrane protein